MSNIPVKRSFTAFTKTIYNGPEINSGSFFWFRYILYIARILTKCWPILQMLQTLNSN